MTIDSLTAFTVPELATIRLQVFGVLVNAPATTIEIAEAINRERTWTWRVLRNLEHEGVIATQRRDWTITNKGVLELRRFYAEMSRLIETLNAAKKQRGVV